MGAFDEARLKDKYGYSGERYSELMEKVIAENHTKIAKTVLTSDKKRFQTFVDRTFDPKRKREIILPDFDTEIKRMAVVGKAAERSNLISKNLREDMRKQIKKSMLESGVTTTRGTVNKNMVRNVKKDLTAFFENNTRRTPGQKVPTNIHTIAVTETRTITNGIRLEYAQRMADQVSDKVTLYKVWVHNDSLSREPRPGHRRVSGQRVGVHEKFKLVIYKKVNGVYKISGSILTDGPHSPGMPAGEVIGCNCELVFEWRLKRR